MSKYGYVNWPGVFSGIPELSEAIKKAPNHVPCPVHGGKDGFRLFENWRETGGGVCNTCGAFPTGYRLLKWLNREIPRSGYYPENNLDIIHVKENKEKEIDYGKRKNFNDSIWESSKSLSEESHAYFIGRGIPLFDLPEPLFLQLEYSMRETKLEYYENRVSLGKYKVILSPFVAGKEMVALHRIYIKDGEKAPVSVPKKITPPSRSLSNVAAFVPLFPEGHPTSLFLAEGIETAIAVAMITGMPCQAVTSHVYMRKAKTRKKSLFIFADGDDVGVEAAMVAKQNNLGVKVFIPPKDMDWLDVYVEDGLDAKKTLDRIKKSMV